MNDQDRWKVVKELFQAVIDKPSAERAAFLGAVSDDSLRRDVQSLLVADAAGGDITLQMPLLDEETIACIVESIHRPGDVTVPAGRRIGPYEVAGLLGAGAMGRVYRAKDTKLDRDVALKLVSAAVATDPAQLTQVAREARVLASLSHPNIAAIYGLEESDGVQILVLELVEGPTLAQRIARGPIPVVEALAVAQQIADALSAAHLKGIIHRDLKPSNIKISETGLVKVLDFGLAKRTVAAGEPQAAVTVASRGPADTAMGLIAGSPSYMSPEQARGDRVDARTDVWAFGSLLFELLTGKRAFQGDSVSSTLTAVQECDPDWSALPDTVPVGIRLLLRRCLAKDPTHRVQTIDEARLAILAVERGRQQRWEFMVAAGVVMIALLGVTAWTLRRSTRAQWARNVAIPQIMRFVAADEYGKAFSLATEVDRAIPGDPILARLRPQFAAPITLKTLPDGADVYVRSYAANDEWQHLGRSPLNEVGLPLGVFQFRLEKDGYETQWLAAPNPSTLLGNANNRLSSNVTFSLAPKESSRGMVAVPSGAFPVSLNAFSTTDPISLDAFLIDRFEVTNEQYRQFLDGGGYRRSDLWEDLPFAVDGHVPWNDGVSRFRDATGTPGPATWASGQYRPGTGDDPVGGVSWYEAVAYCRSHGKVLPTLFHWRRAALSPDEMFAPLAPVLIANSNFGQKGPARVGRFQGLGPYGTYDMAGNVKEWTWNEAQPGNRWIQGGSWADQGYMLVVRDTAPAFDRSAMNGFRCADYGKNPIREELLRALNRPNPRTDRSAPVPALFETFRAQYQPISAPLNARVDVTDRSSPNWVKERISFDAGYEDARVAAYLFLPKAAKPPYQVVLYFPGRSSFVGKMSSDALQPDFLDFVLGSGRAVVWPIYKGSYERWIPTATPSVEQRRLLFDWRQDIGRLLDVLSQRPDINAQGFAYLGLSYGASVPLSLLSLENRFHAAILMSAAMGGVPGFPDADALNYAGHITVPFLLMSGRHDFVYPLETAAKPLFERIATADDQKRHVVFEAGHMMFPRGPMSQEILAWLDRYLGSVVQ